MMILARSCGPNASGTWRRRGGACWTQSGRHAFPHQAVKVLLSPKSVVSRRCRRAGIPLFHSRISALQSGGGQGGGGRLSKILGGSGDDDSDDKPPFGGVAWGSLLVGFALGASVCLNWILLGRKCEAEKPAAIPTQAPEPDTAIFSASVVGSPKPTVAQGKVERISLSDPVHGGALAFLLLCAAIFFSRKKKKGGVRPDAEGAEDVSAHLRGGLLPLPPVGNVDEQMDSRAQLFRGTVEMGNGATGVTGPNYMNINLSTPQASPAVVPVPVVVPFPMPMATHQYPAPAPAPSPAPAPAPHVHVPGPIIPPSPAGSTVILQAPPAVVHEVPVPEPVAKKKQVQRAEEEDEDMGGQARKEKEWVRVLDHPTPNIRTEYEIRGVLGRGSSSMVRSVFRKGTNEEFACKSISKQSLKNKKDEDDVKREIAVMRHLAGNEHFVQLHGVYEDQKSIHMVIDLCRGGELFDSIVAAGNLTEKDAADIIRVILKVIAHCHEMGVMHRDVKPENFLWVDSDASKLKAIDFGLSAFFKLGTPFRDLVGSKYTIAPEVLTRSYSYKADIWSCGVIMYWLLTGLPPFLGDTLHEAFDNIRAGKIDYSSEQWNHISSSAKDCLKHMLVYHPKKRWSAEELLRHEWVNGVAPDKPISTAVMNKFQDFAGMNRLQQVTRKVIAERLPLESLEGLQNMFQGLDVDQDGTITINEIRAELNRKKVSFPQEELEVILKAADADGNGEINIGEFLAATVNAVDLMKEENLLMAFEHFDQDGSGFITHEELKQVLMEQFPGSITENIDQLISEIDKDNDGQINYEEFKGMMLGE